MRHGMQLFPDDMIVDDYIGLKNNVPLKFISNQLLILTK